MIVSVILANGARAMARKKVIVKHLAAIQNFGSIDVLCSDKTGTLTSGKMALDRYVDPWGEPSTRVLTLARLNSNNQTGIRSPLDDAILATPKTEEEAGYQKRDEIPYDFQRRRLSVVLEHESHRALITKGAPEGVLENAVAVERGGQVMPLNADTRVRCQRTFEELSRKGLRVLAVAYVMVEPRANLKLLNELLAA
jgi:Mg2+-importing ATPase